MVHNFHGFYRDVSIHRRLNVIGCRHYASHQKYSDTLNLPQTTFPLRPDHATNAVETEPAVLYRWQRERQKDKIRTGASDSVSTTDEFILHDGPPFANGNLHIGHALNKILKDIIVRRKILEGRTVRFVPGWDCHGLPIELKALQAHQHASHEQSDSPQFQAMPAPTIRAMARELAEETIKSQSSQFQKMSICADWSSPYKTLDLSYELAQLQIFANMVDRGLVYRADKPVYWSPSSRTALAEAELEYVDNHTSHAAYIAYPLATSFMGRDDVNLLIWTTTPWTLPANRAIAVNRDLEYCLLSVGGDARIFVVAKALVETVQRIFSGDVHVVGSSFNGAELLQYTYRDVFNAAESSRPVLGADYVSSESGTGLVHTAPGHGMEDYLLCREQMPPIEPFSPVDDAGDYTSSTGVEELIGLNVQNDGSKRVISILQANKALVATEKYKHKYPYDWRTKQPIIVRSTPQFFADISSIRDSAQTSIDQVEMVPASGKARLKSYVESRDEWCISRQRSWGVPIPVLHAADGEVLLTKTSITHIINVLRNEGTDAWFAEDKTPDDWQKWVPEELRGSKKWSRGRETLDVWFDSGCSWTTLQKTGSSKPVVADLYLEGSDQHRGWFQSSLLTSISTRGIAPYKQVLTHGFVLDHKGHKMSKSLGNVIDPLLVISGRAATDPMPVDSQITDKKKRKQLEKIAREAATEIKPLGTDALRLWVAQSDYTNDVSVSTNILGHVAESLRKFRTTIRYMIANLQDYDPAVTMTRTSYRAIDQYAESLSSKFRSEAESNFSSATFNKVVASLNQYTNAQLSAFYFDTLKDRLYADNSESASRRSAQAALLRILKDYLLVLAPICPVMIQEAWQHMPKKLAQDAPHIYASEWSNQAVPVSHIDHAAWQRMMQLRDNANKELEIARSQKLITSSLQADLIISLPENVSLPIPDGELPNFFIVSSVHVTRTPSQTTLAVSVKKAELLKCPRCWTFTTRSEDTLCGRCKDALAM